jgi:hypothetical protein
VKQGFILGFVIGYLLEDLQDILQLFTPWRNKKDSSATAIKLERSIEVHGPML